MAAGHSMGDLLPTQDGGHTPHLHPGPCASCSTGGGGSIHPYIPHLNPDIHNIIPFHYGHHTHNISESALAFFSASIYGGEADGIPVPFVELIAHAVLMLSLVVVLLRIALRSRTRKLLVADSWSPVPATDVAVRLFTGLTALALVVTMLEVGLMFVPMPHVGLFSTVVYASASARSLPPVSHAPFPFSRVLGSRPSSTWGPLRSPSMAPRVRPPSRGSPVGSAPPACSALYTLPARP